MKDDALFPGGWTTVSYKQQRYDDDAMQHLSTRILVTVSRAGAPSSYNTSCTAAAKRRS